MSAKPTGTYCWADLLVSDQPTALDFYRAIAGWAVEPGGAEYGGYAMAYLGDATPETAVAGIHGMAGPGGPAWMAYLATDDLDATLAKVTASGGVVGFGPQDVPGVGRTAFCSDPTGAGFGLWEAGPFAGFGAFSGEPGSFCWAELYSTDAIATRDFFVAILGYDARPLSETDEFTYFQMAIPTNPEGRQIQFGVMQMTYGRMFAEGTPSSMGQYLSVSDVDAVTEQAVALGATVDAPPMDSPFGRMSVIVDPTGATLSLIDVSKATGGI